MSVARLPFAAVLGSQQHTQSSQSAPPRTRTVSNEENNNPSPVSPKSPPVIEEARVLESGQGGGGAAASDGAQDFHESLVVTGRAIGADDADSEIQSSRKYLDIHGEVSRLDSRSLRKRNDSRKKFTGTPEQQQDTFWLDVGRLILEDFNRQFDKI